MKNQLVISLLLSLLSGCYKSPVIVGFDSARWRESVVCAAYRLEGAMFLAANKTQMQGLSQNEIINLLGTGRHQLDERNEKYFYYTLTRDCADKPNQSLEVRFDAVGRVRDVQVILD
jgi:hypothetical protein